MGRPIRGLTAPARLSALVRRLVLPVIAAALAVAAGFLAVVAAPRPVGIPALLGLAVKIAAEAARPVRFLLHGVGEGRRYARQGDRPLRDVRRPDLGHLEEDDQDG